MWIKSGENAWNKVSQRSICEHNSTTDAPRATNWAWYIGLRRVISKLSTSLARALMWSSIPTPPLSCFRIILSPELLYTLLASDIVVPAPPTSPFHYNAALILSRTASSSGYTCRAHHVQMLIQRRRWQQRWTTHVFIVVNCKRI